LGLDLTPKQLNSAMEACDIDRSGAASLSEVDIMLRAAANTHKERVAAAEKARPAGADLGLGAGIGDIDEDDGGGGGGGGGGRMGGYRQPEAAHPIDIPWADVLPHLPVKERALDKRWLKEVRSNSLFQKTFETFLVFRCAA